MMFSRSRIFSKRERERERERENTFLLHEDLQLQNRLWMEQVYIIIKNMNKKCSISH